MAEQQNQPPPTEQQQYPHTGTQQSSQPYDLNQQQAAAPYDQNQQQATAPNDPSYEAYNASYCQQQQQYCDPNAHSQEQPEAPQVRPQQHDPAYHPHYPEGFSDARRGSGGPFRGGGRRGGECGRGRGHSGGINPNTSTPAIPIPPPPLHVLKIWCEICRAECNSLEMLEKHKNGKRHKKTAQRYEEMQKQQKLVAEYKANSMPGTIYATGCQQANAMPDTKQTAEYQQANVMPTLHADGYQQENTKLSTVHSSSVKDNAPSVEEQEKNLPTPESITAAEVSSTQLEPVKACETTSNNVQVDDPNKSHKVELEQKGSVATAEGTAELPNSGNYNQFDARQGGMKRKISKNGQDGKKLKKSKRNIPEPQRICTVCNVTCESPVVFDAHIAGKKHISKLRTFQQHGAVFGPITVYIPPNQPTANPIRRPDPLFFGLSSYQMVGQLTYSIEGAHHGNIESQDAPLVFAQKEKIELENNVNNVINCATQESDPKERDDMLVNDAVGVGITSDDTLRSESEDNSEEIAVGAEVPALDFELKERSISETGDILKVAEDFALDAVSKEKDNKEADDVCNVEEIVGGSESEEKSILKKGESKDNSVEIAVGAEVPALDFELKEKSISEMGDTLKVAQDFALDSVSKEKDKKEADDTCNIEEIVGGSESEENSILKTGNAASVT